MGKNKKSFSKKELEYFTKGDPLYPDNKDIITSLYAKKEVYLNQNKMKAKLIKRDSDYFLEVEYWYPKFKYPTIIANTLDKPDGLVLNLSKQNCDEIFGIVNVEELAQEVCDDTISSPYHCYIAGFNKNAELNKDKVFTLEDMRKAFDEGCDMVDSDERFDDVFNRTIQSLQQPTEIEVEIVTEKVVDETKVIGGVKGVKGSGHKITTYKSIPKLDSSGNLILKKI
jgi:hypothetical protein